MGNADEPKKNTLLLGRADWRIFLLPLSSVFQIFSDRFHDVGRLIAAVALGVFLILAMVAMRKARTFTTSL